LSSPYYTQSFYEQIGDAATRSAGVILPLVFELTRVRSLVDVGCGEANWLAICRKLGVEDVLGIDGDYVDRDRLQIPQSQFQAFDLENPFSLGRVFDLAISLEVAEHLPADSAPNFVECLTRLAPLVLFSAAIPHQIGNHHVNEQWPDNWAALFKGHNYLPIDFIRKRVWQNDAVEWWYAQNVLLFARRDFLENSPTLKAEFEKTNPAQLCLVHPKQYLYLHKLYVEALVPDEPVSWSVMGASRLLLSCLRSALSRRFHSLLSRRPPLQTDSHKPNDALACERKLGER
jgi:SAM-dependent methyltransferase